MPLQTHSKVNKQWAGNCNLFYLSGFKKGLSEADDAKLTQ